MTARKRPSQTTSSGCVPSNTGQLALSPGNPASERSTRSGSAQASPSSSPCLDEESIHDWGHGPVEDLVGTKLEWSTIEEAAGKAKCSPSTHRCDPKSTCG
eukprot:scaffold10872_cov129-Isochrysis_galbana.AAC.2